MSAAEHHRTVAAAFTERVHGTRDWDVPAPVEGWTARDVVEHLVRWLPGLLAADGVELEPGPEGDPVTAWDHHVVQVQALLDAPDADRPFTHPQLGTLPLDQAVDRFYTPDVFMHTWDLARATGQDDRLDPGFSEALLEGMTPIESLLRESGQYGPAVPVPEDADVQDRLLGFIGRDPAWRPAV